jgi:hypothetical protein
VVQKAAILELACGESARRLSVFDGDFKSFDDSKRVPGINCSRLEGKIDRLVF